VVDGRAISQDVLKDELDLALSDPRLAQQVAGPGGTDARANLTRQVLADLITRAVAAEYAEARSIMVTPADIDQALQATVAQVGGQAEFDKIVQARGLTMADVSHILGGNVLLQKVRDDVVARLPSPPAGSAENPDQAFQRWLFDQVVRADVFVNPRFGRFDPTTGGVAPISSTADLG
jgi:SurA-like N-terminal domain